MSNANTSLWTTSMGSIRRHLRTRFDKLQGNTPAIIFDPNLTTISHVVVHDLAGGVQFMSIEKAEEKRYVAVEPKGNQKTYVFLLRNPIEVSLMPSNETIRALIVS